MALWEQYLEMILGPFAADGMRYTIQSGWLEPEDLKKMLKRK